MWNFQEKGFFGIMEATGFPVASTEISAVVSLQKHTKSLRKKLIKEVRSKKKQDKKTAKP